MNFRRLSYASLPGAQNCSATKLPVDCGYDGAIASHHTDQPFKVSRCARILAFVQVAFPNEHVSFYQKKVKARWAPRFWKSRPVSWTHQTKICLRQFATASIYSCFEAYVDTHFGIEICHFRGSCPRAVVESTSALAFIGSLH